MIQRIQTIYLLIATILVSITIFTPYAYFLAEGGTYDLCVFSLQSQDGVAIQSTIYAGILLVLSAVLPFVTIFLYNRRLLQIRLCVVEIILLVGSAVIMSLYYFLSNRVFAEFDYSSQGFKIGFVLPIIAIVFVYLALRAIFKDEVLVRSQDRIR